MVCAAAGKEISAEMRRCARDLRGERITGSRDWDRLEMRRAECRGMGVFGKLIFGEFEGRGVVGRVRCRRAAVVRGGWQISCVFLFVCHWK